MGRLLVFINRLEVAGGNPELDNFTASLLYKLPNGNIGSLLFSENSFVVFQFHARCKSGFNLNLTNLLWLDFH